jgi:hypothetical protein
MCADHFQRLASSGGGVAGVQLELRDLGAVRVFASTGVDLPSDHEPSPESTIPVGDLAALRNGGAVPR